MLGAELFEFEFRRLDRLPIAGFGAGAKLRRGGFEGDDRLVAPTIPVVGQPLLRFLGVKPSFLEILRRQEKHVRRWVARAVSCGKCGAEFQRTRRTRCASESPIKTLPSVSTKTPWGRASLHCAGSPSGPSPFWPVPASNSMVCLGGIVEPNRVTFGIGQVDPALRIDAHALGAAEHRGFGRAAIAGERQLFPRRRRGGAGCRLPDRAGRARCLRAGRATLRPWHRRPSPAARTAATRRTCCHLERSSSHPCRRKW